MFDLATMQAAERRRKEGYEDGKAGREPDFAEGIDLDYIDRQYVNGYNVGVKEAENEAE